MSLYFGMSQQINPLPTINWTLKTGVSSYNITSIAYGNNVFLFCSDRGCSTTNAYVRKSLDNGESWSDSRTSGGDTSACGYINNKWVVFNRCNEGNYNLAYSSNLSTSNTWSTLKTNGKYHYNIWEANNYLVGGTYDSYYVYSTDGSTWTSRRLEDVNAQAIQNASYSSKNSLYYIKTSNNNKTFTMSSLNGTGQEVLNALSGSSYYTVHGANESLAFVYNSASNIPIKKDTGNGKSFNINVTSLPTYTSLAGIKYYNGMYIMTYTNTADYTKHVALSTDGSTWTELTVPSWNATIYNGNSNIACGLINNTNYIMITASNSTSVLIGTY